MWGLLHYRRDRRSTQEQSNGRAENTIASLRLRTFCSLPQHHNHVRLATGPTENEKPPTKRAASEPMMAADGRFALGAVRIDLV
jgi:hypothetical protein